MKRSLAVLAAFVSLSGAAFGAALAPVKFGEKVNDLEFKDIRFLTRNLSDIGKPKAFVLVFLNTECPVAQKYLPKLKELDTKYGPQEVQLVGIYNSQNDSVRDMASHALESGIKFPVVKDVNQLCTKRLGIERVPQVAIIDGEGKLVYRGRIDDQYRVGGTQPKISNDDLVKAIDEILAGKSVSVQETPVDGCKVTPWKPVEIDHAVTFHEHISAIMQKHCQECHHAGTPAPFPLVSYKDVQSQAEMIAEVVDDQRMPPWYASPKHGHFKNNADMPKEERDLVAAWVKAGMPEGDASKAPAPLSFPTSEWRIGEPDLKITMTQTHDVPAEGYVDYKYVFLPYVFSEDTYVEAIEIRPHNRAVVHHCNMAYASLRQGKGGRETFITGYVPGGQPMVFTNGTAYKIPKGSVLVLQIHYTTTGREEKGKISVGFRYAKSGVVNKLSHFHLHDVRPLAIPPNDPMAEFTNKFEFKEDATLLGMFSHMHVRGRDMSFDVKRPDGSEERILEIPNYSFDWQLGYESPLPPHGVKIPKGTTMTCTAHYDNSKFNAYNPDPTRTVPYGDQTFDEMFNGFVFYTYDNENLNLKVDPKTGHVIQDSKESVAQK